MVEFLALLLKDSVLTAVFYGLGRAILRLLTLGRYPRGVNLDDVPFIAFIGLATTVFLIFAFAYLSS